jgi:glutamate-1-semialdehyde 2,1-aminomutase
VFFSGRPVRDFADARAADHDRYARFFHHMLDHGVWLPPSGYEVWTIGTDHGQDEVELVLRAAGSFRG